MANFLLYGRGGQGIDSATRLVGNALFAGDLQVQDFVLSGMEKRGFPVQGWVKADKAPLLSRDVPAADFMLIFDMTLPVEGILKNCAPGATVIFNSPERVKVKKGEFRAYFVDASGISYTHTRSPRPNTAMLGALAKIYPKIPSKHLRSGIVQMPMQKENTQAFEDGYRNVKRN